MSGREIDQLNDIRGVWLMAQDHAETKEKPARSGKTGAGRAVVPARRGGPRLATLKARLAAGVGALGLVMVLISALVLGRASSAVRELERSQYAGIATETRIRLDRLVGRDRTRLMDAGFADGLYALVGKGIAPPDSFIRPNFAERFAAQYGDRFIGVFDLSGTRLFAWSDPTTPGLEAVAASNPLFRILDNREPAVGLIRRGDQLYWVAGVPILPTNYTDAAQPIRGYLVVAQPFNQTAIAPAAADRSGRLELNAFDAPKAPFRTRVVDASTKDSVRVEFTLPDIFAEQNTLAGLTTSRSEFRLVESRIFTATVIALLAIVALTAAAWVLAMKWLVGPTTRLAEILTPVQQGQVPGLVGSVSPATEWTLITSALNRLTSVSRTASERFERLTGAGIDGLFERDLASGDWTTNARFRDLLGLRDQEASNPLPALADRFHPDDAPALLAWLGATAPTPAQFAANVRIRRPGRDWSPVRFEAVVGTDNTGAPARITGRIADRSEQRAAEASVAAVEANRAVDRQATGRFLAGVAETLPPEVAPAIRRPLEIIGNGLAGSLAADPGPFDLYALLQDVANATPGSDLSIVPGVPDRVIGDRVLIRSAVERLIAAAGSAARVAIRAEQPDRVALDLVRIVVEAKTTDSRTDRMARIEAALATGAADGPDPLLDCRAAHFLAAALGGTAGAGAEGFLVRRWISIPLKPAPMAAPATGSADGEPDWGATDPASFSLETEPTPAFPAPARPSGAQSVELVADATVTIDFDDPSVTKPPVGTTVTTALAAGDQTALKAARIALADLPARLKEARGASKAGEIRTVAAIATTIQATATALEAFHLERACRDLIDAAESQYLESSDDLVRAIERAWTPVEAALQPYRAAAAASPAAPPAERDTKPEQAPRPEPAPRPQPVTTTTADTPPIDQVTLEQLTASLADGSGLGTQLVTLFLTEAPSRIEAIERAAGAGDWAALRTSSGDLKGMCALIGAGPLADRCAVAGEAAGPAAWTEAMAIRSEWERVQRVLDGLMAARSGA